MYSHSTQVKISMFMFSSSFEQNNESEHCAKLEKQNQFNCNHTDGTAVCVIIWVNIEMSTDFCYHITTCVLSLRRCIYKGKSLRLKYSVVCTLKLNWYTTNIKIVLHPRKTQHNLPNEYFWNDGAATTRNCVATKW